MATATKKMQTFTWVGRDAKGRTVRGEQDAPNPAYVKALLRRQGVQPEKVRKQPKPLFQFKSKIKTKDISIFSRQLSTMISAGIPVASAINSMSRAHNNPAMRELLTQIRQDVEAGNNLSDAMAKHPDHFDELFVSLVGAGERSGTLDTLLDKIAVYKEKLEAIKSKVRSAMFYPAAVIVVSFIVTAILMIFVIPAFEDLFQDFGADLPALTRAVVNMSEFFQKYWGIMFLVFFGSIYLIGKAYKKSAGVRHKFDGVLLKLPVLGELLQKAAVARFCRTLGTMFGAGVPIIDALEAVSGATGNAVYANATKEIQKQVTSGQQLVVAMESTKLFPSMVLQMVGTGEETGELENMLEKVADFYEGEVDDAVEALSSLIEPFIIVFLGGLIGTLVIAMYLPIFKMAAAV